MTKLPKGWKLERLDRLAEIQTGIAKGAQKGKPVVSLPYLRVANVQDGHVDLTEMKVIEVPVRKVDRYRLRRGDLLMTEGGDFDKLGRGCIWEGQIVCSPKPCVRCSSYVRRIAQRFLGETDCFSMGKALLPWVLEAIHESRQH